jgi:hypothetical protein
MLNKPSIMVYLTTIYRRMVRSSVHNELEMTWKEVVVAYFETSPGGTEET